MFNVITKNLDLRELAPSGRKFTWARRRENPTYEKLE
jgi:hypothetical protein